MRQIIEDFHEYAKSDLAGTHRSTAGTQPPVDPQLLEGCLGQLQRDGFVVVERLIGPDQLATIRAELEPHFPQRGGRNNFEGFATHRIYSVIEKTFSCNPLVEHPLALALLDRILAPNYLLSQLQAIKILPGEAAQPVHHDDAIYPVARPRAPLGAATIFAIDDFTAENGATVVLPGSHLWPDVHPKEADLSGARPVVMPAGSMLFFVGTLWHHGGANRSAAPRLAVSAQYCQPWCRQQESFSLSVSRERVRQCSEHIKRLLGYSIHPPFMGFVDGMHPKRVLERA